MTGHEQITGLARTLRRLAYKTHIEAIKTVGSYTLHIWQDMREYFHQEQDAFEFIDSLTAEITNQYTRAWNEGARAAGVDPRDMADPDLAHLDDMIRAEFNFVLGLAEDIDNARYREMTDQEFAAAFKGRADLWANRYTEVKNEAVVWFSGFGKKLKYVLGPTEEHCHTGDRPNCAGCADLNGMVLYAQEWEKTGIRPGESDSQTLACGGWRCQCKLEPTDDRKTTYGFERVMSMLGR